MKDFDLIAVERGASRRFERAIIAAVALGLMVRRVWEIRPRRTR